MLPPGEANQRQTLDAIVGDDLAGDGRDVI